MSIKAAGKPVNYDEGAPTYDHGTTPVNLPASLLGLLEGVRSRRCVPLILK